MVSASVPVVPCETPIAVKPAPCRTKLGDITTRLKGNLTKVKKITQAEGRTTADSAAAKNASGKDGKGAAEGGGEQGGSWRDAGGILDDVKEGINVNLKDVNLPEFDVR